MTYLYIQFIMAITLLTGSPELAQPLQDYVNAECTKVAENGGFTQEEYMLCQVNGLYEEVK